MNKFKHYVWMAAGFAVLIGVVSGLTAAPAIAQALKAALVKNVDERGRVPYSAVVICQIASDNCFANTPAVPAGKRLVIEHVSAFNQIASPGQIAFYRLLLGNSVRAALPMSTPINNQGFNNSAVNESVLVYAEAGDVLTIQITATAASPTLTTNAYLSGYLVDLTI